MWWWSNLYVLDYKLTTASILLDKLLQLAILVLLLYKIVLPSISSNAMRIWFVFIYVALNFLFSWGSEHNNTLYAEQFFSLARIHSNTSKYHSFTQVHLIRIPKASSTSLSAVARRMVGCNPPGPCCNWPGDPVGSCPAKGLYDCETQNKVIGCTNHKPNIHSLMNKAVHSISIIREPKSRSISAFFYPGMHHNSQCTGDMHHCFLEYVKAENWKNIATKMMTGLFAYAPTPVCELASQCPHSLQLAINNLDKLEFMGIAEMWELSMLLFHYKFQQIEPVFDEFLHESESVVTPNTTSSARKLTFYSHSSSISIASNYSSDWLGFGSHRALLVARENHGLDYSQFKKSALTMYANELEQQNKFDLLLYHKAVDNMCKELHSNGLWNSELSGHIIQEYWSKKSVIKTIECP